MEAHQNDRCSFCVSDETVWGPVLLMAVPADFTATEPSMRITSCAFGSSQHSCMGTFGNAHIAKKFPRLFPNNREQAQVATAMVLDVSGTRLTRVEGYKKPYHIPNSSNWDEPQMSSLSCHGKAVSCEAYF
eukprot:4190194-Amphidinium_carterae.3